MIIVPIVSRGSLGAAPAGGNFIDSFENNMLVAGIPPPLIGRMASSQPAPYGSIPNNSIAVLTNIGVTRMNQIASDGLVFGNFEFQVGRGGYDTVDPTQATVPNPAAIGLADPVFPSAVTYEPVDRIDTPNANSKAFLCRLERAECLFAIGELGVFAQVTDPGTTGLVIGDRFMLAIMHFPMRAKCQEVMGYRLPIQAP